MAIVTYDVEVFSHDWLVVFKDKKTSKYTCIWNDNEAVKNCIDDNNIYVGFNNKHYDQFIIKAICSDFSEEQVKAVNDYIIGGGQGWNCPLLKDIYFSFPNVDLRDDTQTGLSLKAIEGHLGLNIKESEVDFKLNRHLTEDEKAETIMYCKHDVDTTEKLLELRKDYLNNKINLGRLAGISDDKALGMTNAKLTAAMLKAKAKSHDDERQYVYPDNLKKEYIPKEVFDFFNRLYDENISDEECFKGKDSKYKFMVGDCEVTMGFGGIHGAIPNYFWEKSEGRIIINMDVGSYYPHLCTINGYTSRNIPSPKTYADVLERRMQAKAAGDTKTANALKLVCNTTYGCLLNQYNDLYDPLMGRSVCISGQLYLLELSMHCVGDIPNIKLVQLNTDGIMVELDESDRDKFYGLCNEWQERTHFELEEDKIIKIAQKDVNNYLMIKDNGKVKAKGGYLVKGISPAGAFNVNNSCVIVATALKEYLAYGTSVEKTINECTDIMQFQMIAKAGVKYREAYHLVDGEKIPVQRVNRVYATSDERYGKIYKVKAENDSEAKIDSLPEHCLIDNENQLSIEDIDKSFYIEMAKKRVNDFLGIKPEKKNRRANMTAAKTTENVYQKLLRARSEFLKANIEKTGKNMHLSFKYFELEDIVPTAIKVFEEVGLVSVVNFTEDTAIMRVVNTDKTDEIVEFIAPFNQIKPIVSNTGKQATNEMQALGSSITYMRRYLYMIALDICESDEIDGNLGSKPTEDKPAKPTVPATPEERKEVKEELTAPSDNASELQIKGLKSVLKKLRASDDSKEQFVAEIALKTNGFKKISKADCEALINEVTQMLEASK